MKNQKIPQPKHFPKEITLLFEDKDLIIVDKPCGLLSVAAKYERENTVQNLLNIYFRKGSIHSKKEVFAVNRLDRETSGIIIFAKTLEFREKMHENWPNFTKKYLAVVAAKVPNKDGIIESYLSEDDNYQVKSTKNTEKGKIARTAYKVIHEGKNYSTLEVNLLTGRKNQIRVHFSENAFPIINDAKYGTAGKERLALHAWHFEFIHPRNNQAMIIETPIPTFFNKYLPN